MKRLILSRKAPMYASIALVAALVACKATWDFDARADLLGAKGRIALSYDGSDINVDKLPGDVAVDMEFTDEDGNVVRPGATGVQEGNRVEPPPGASTVIITGPSGNQGGCTGCSASLWDGDDGIRVAHLCRDGGSVLTIAGAESLSATSNSRPGQQRDAVPGYKDVWIHIETFIPDYDGSSALKNVSFAADLRVPSHFNARNIYNVVKPIILNGPGIPVPTSTFGLNVEIESFTQIVANGLLSFSDAATAPGGPPIYVPRIKFGGMRLFSMDVTSAFTLFDLDINGFQIADSSILNTGRHSTAPNGWRVIEVNVPNSALIYDADSAQLVLELRTQTPEDSIVIETNKDAATRE